MFLSFLQLFISFWLTFIFELNFAEIQLKPVSLTYLARFISTTYSIKLILNTFSGGWAGGSADSSDFIKNADLMWKQSVWSSGISAALAAHHLKPGGCIVLPGESFELIGPNKLELEMTRYT